MKANELKVTDLMVGDWVISIGAPHKIVGVRTDMLEPHIKTDMSDTWYEEGIEDLLEPIPLTQEILEKNGLANDLYGCHFKEDEYMALEISSEEEGIYWTINYNEYGILKLQYVHELQHALKLCGIDKEIVV